jgi:hypothetical protein
MKNFINAWKLIKRCRKPIIYRSHGEWIVRYDPWFIDRFLARRALMAVVFINNTGRWPRGEERFHWYQNLQKWGVE